MSDPRPRRLLGLWALTFYGVGDILGAGIYAVVGKVAGHAGASSCLAFGVALAVAAPTALVYAELGGRFPRSGGEAYFSEKAFRSPSLSFVIGWLVFWTGIVSLATVSRAFAGYAREIMPDVPDLVPLIVVLIVLGGINFSGIRHSSTANIVCTVIEMCGLLIVVAVGLAYMSGGESDAVVQPAVREVGVSWTSVLEASVLAFFAFIGFEDMVNVAEETKAPERNLPIAIILALTIAGGLYLLIIWVATAVVSPATLAGSDSPLLQVVARAAPTFPLALFTIIALFAVANTGLLNSVMASRLLYGMANRGLLPRCLGRLHPGRRTPHWAIATTFAITVALASSGTLEYLAGTTSVLILLVFCSMNVSLIVIRRREKPREGFRVPLIVPIAGALLTVSMMMFADPGAILTGTVVAALGGLIALLKVGRRPLPSDDHSER